MIKSRVSQTALHSDVLKLLLVDRVKKRGLQVPILILKPVSMALPECGDSGCLRDCGSSLPSRAHLQEVMEPLGDGA